jgi:hypothetical protein
MKKFALIGLLVLMGWNTNAQEATAPKPDTLWETGGLTALNFTQTSFTNWAGGGESSISASGIVNLFADYKKGKVSWDNTLDLALGALNQSWDGWAKTDDRVELNSKLGKYAFKNWDYYGMLTVRTNLFPGYDEPLSDTRVKIADLFAPGYLLLSIGLDYKPSKNFYMLISPITGKSTIVTSPSLSNAGAFGVDPGESIRNEFGGFVKFMYKTDLMKNVGFLAKVDFFTNYAENPGNIDVNGEMLLSFKVNKYISGSLSVLVVYDDDVQTALDRNDDDVLDGFGPRTQIKEVFGLGFSYKFPQPPAKKE